MTARKYEAATWDESDFHRHSETRLPTRLYPFRLEKLTDEEGRGIEVYQLVRLSPTGKETKHGVHDGIWDAFRAMLDAYQAYWPTRPAERVYFIGDELRVGGSLKIGYSKYPGQRLRQLQTASPRPLQIFATCPGGRDLEADYHRRWRARRGAGEWFTIGDTILKEIARLNELPHQDRRV